MQLTTYLHTIFDQIQWLNKHCCTHSQVRDSRKYILLYYNDNVIFKIAYPAKPPIANLT